MASFPVVLFSHKSLLRRDYPEPWRSLQDNKIVNCRIAVKRMNGIVIRPGEKFSFWKVVGRTTRRRGFVDGMTMADGRLTSSLGGGLCQLSNALYWTALNCGFEIIERHRHSYDIFPDTARTLPFGSGATVFYNYVDLAFSHRLEGPVLLRIWLDDLYLNVEARCSVIPQVRYEIEEKNHRFEESEGVTWRSNELYRVTKDETGTEVGRELIAKNHAKVLYDR